MQDLLLSAMSDRSMEPAQLCTILIDVANTACKYPVADHRIHHYSGEQDDFLEDSLPRNRAKNKSRLLVAFTGQLGTTEHRVWAGEMSTDWWDRSVMQVWDNEQGQLNFQMCKATFLDLCVELTPALQGRDTQMRAALAVEKQAAITRWKLATPDCSWSEGNHSGAAGRG